MCVIKNNKCDIKWIEEIEKERELKRCIDIRSLREY
jgi:hypothetical protein